MKATETQLVKFLQGTKQFAIPIYQRTYSWTEKECDQLWDDIIRVARNETIPSHFIGSIVYIEKGLYQVSDVPRLLVIDGQQRLTTLSLLLAAFGKVLGKKGGGTEITKDKIDSYFLFNSHESGEKRYKLVLTQNDKETLNEVLDERESPNLFSNIVNNFKFFEEKITKNSEDLDMLYRGILKLVIVDVALDSNYDNPQLIFESLNSTGLELSQADLIRNYILMNLEKETQERIYKEHWFQMEKSFGHSSGSAVFDRFMRDYLTIKTGTIPNIRDVYRDFKAYKESEGIKVEELASDIHNHSKFFIKLAFSMRGDSRLNRVMRDINSLKVDVAYPFLLEMLVEHDRGKISADDLVKIFLTVESYVFRRAVCDIPTNSLSKTFANLAREMGDRPHLESVRATLCLKKAYRRFPNDGEFREHFSVKNVYTLKIKKYLLDKLENFDRKETVHTGNYTIEHIMPQNKILPREWQDELGSKWVEVHEKYLHTIGNLTLTGYNSELSDKPFLQKRDMQGGFAESPLWLNSSLATLEHWNEDEILRRAGTIADRAVKIWRFSKLSQETLAMYEAPEDDVDEDSDEDEASKPQWDELLESASDKVRQAAGDLTEQILKRFDCKAEPRGKWLFFYVQKPTERKNCFALIGCSKSTTNVMFRVDQDTFADGEHVRRVGGWFFPRGTERRMSIKHERVPEILRCLDHAYNTTSEMSRKRHKV